MIQETKLSKDELEIFAKKLGIRSLEGSPANGALGGLAVIWDPRILVFNLLYKTSNWLCGRINNTKCNLNFVLFNIYGPIQNKDKKKIWDEIEQFLTSIPDRLCIIGGEFNAILDPSEKWGGH